MMKTNKLSKSIAKNNALFIFLGLAIVTAIVYGEKFLSVPVILNLFTQNGIEGLVAIGMTCVILTGCIDLSVGAVVAASGLLAASLSSGNVIVVVISCAAFGIGIGLLNGIIVEKLRIVPFIATLATMTGIRGVNLLVTDGKSISASEATESFFNIAQWDTTGLTETLAGPGATEEVMREMGNISASLGRLPLFFYFLAAVIVLFVILKYTRFGRSIYAVGGNVNAAKMMGINTSKVTISVYVISGLLSALAGCVLASRLKMGQYAAGEGWEMDAIAATVLGGTLMSGGKGQIWGTFFGVLILGLIEQIFIMQGNINVWWQNIVTGAILLVVVMIQSRTDKKKEV